MGTDTVRRLSPWLALALASLCMGCTGPGGSDPEPPCAELPGPERLAVVAGLEPRIDASGGDPARGSKLFAEHCTRCHSPAASERGSRFFRSYPRLDCPAYVEGVADDHLAAAIQYGSEPFGGNAAMVAWGEVLSDAEIADLVAYLRQP